MLADLRQRNFAFLWLAGLISTVGPWALCTALPYSVFEQIGSVLAIGTKTSDTDTKNLRTGSCDA